jgi:hypothetical protein
MTHHFHADIYVYTVYLSQEQARIILHIKTYMYRVCKMISAHCMPI